MKKRLFIIVSILILGLVFGIYLFHTNKGAGTVIEAIEQSGRHVNLMIHQEKVQNGVVIFFKSDVGNEYSLNSGFVKQGLFGWKWVWGGGFSGYSGQYFPSDVGTPFPLLFGEIKSQGIEQVKIFDKEHKETKVAKVVGTDNNRIWFLFLDKSDGPDFEIVNLSNKGEVLDSKSINITDTNF